MIYDDYFEELLQTGDREICARYRNCIIEELRQRAECKKDAIVVKKSLSTKHKEIVRLKRWQIFCTALSLTGTLAALDVTIRISQGFMLMRVCAIILATMNGLFFVKHVFDSFFLSSMLKGAESTVVYVTRAPHAYADLPESFRSIPVDSDEILQNKKEKLDELLGF